MNAANLDRRKAGHWRIKAAGLVQALEVKECVKAKAASKPPAETFGIAGFAAEIESRLLNIKDAGLGLMKHCVLGRPSSKPPAYSNNFAGFVCRFRF